MKGIECVPSPAAGAAGSAWRRKRLTDLIAGAESAGLDGVPEVQALLACVGEHTAHLEELWQAQQVRLVSQGEAALLTQARHGKIGGMRTPRTVQARPGGRMASTMRPKLTGALCTTAAAALRPNDRRLSTARCRCNEEGIRFLKQALFSHAFASFSDAISLCPTSAAYHANRASIALRLGRFTIALQDARCVSIKQLLQWRPGVQCIASKRFMQPRHQVRHCEGARPCASAPACRTSLHAPGSPGGSPGAVQAGSGAQASVHACAGTPLYCCVVARRVLLHLLQSCPRHLGP